MRGFERCFPPFGDLLTSIELLVAGDLTMADMAATDPGLNGASMPSFILLTEQIKNIDQHLNINIRYK